VAGSPRAAEQRLVWVDAKGNVDPVQAPPRKYLTPTLSPDGHYAAVAILSGTWRIWIYDFSRGTLTPLTSGPSSQLPVWTPDGKHIVYRGTRRGFRNLYWMSADGSKSEERLTTNENLQGPVSFSPDGKWLAFYEIDNQTGYDIWVMPLDGDRKPQVFLKTPFNEGVPRFSPDGKWLAYMSTESGREEVYVRPFPGPGGRWLISAEAGNEPIWSRDGRKLFYVNRDKMRSVDVITQPSFKAGPPQFLYEGHFESGWERAATSGYDVSPDGARFLRLQPVEPEQRATQIQVVINWFEELKRRVAATQGSQHVP
jgi:eukaryotic-like serine/threonine-protein kinase